MLEALAIGAATRPGMVYAASAMPFRAVALRKLAMHAFFVAFDAPFTGGVSVAVGDLTGDGVSELITGTGAGSADVRLWSFTNAAATERAGFFAYDLSFAGGVSVARGLVSGEATRDRARDLPERHPHRVGDRARDRRADRAAVGAVVEEPQVRRVVVRPLQRLGGVVSPSQAAEVRGAGRGAAADRQRAGGRPVLVVAVGPRRPTDGPRGACDHRPAVVEYTAVRHESYEGNLSARV